MLNDALKNWRDWDLLEKPNLVHVFNDGLNHHTGLIESGGQRFVIKVFKHSFNRTIETECWTSELGLSPKLHMAANNIALYEFIEDQGYTPAKVSNIALTLQRAHQSKATSVGDFDLLTFCETYLSEANQATHKWHADLMPILVEFTNDLTPWVFCHNDLVAQNCIFKHGSAMFIDWEFAQRNNPWFDLGAIIHYFELNNSEALKFLSSYDVGLQKKTNDRIFYTSQIAVLWCDLLWSMHTLSRDYKDQNLGRFDQLSKLAHKLGIELPAQSQ